MTMPKQDPASPSSRSESVELRGQMRKTHSGDCPADLAEIVEQTVRLWRKHHLTYDQTKYVVEQVRRRLAKMNLALRGLGANLGELGPVGKLSRSSRRPNTSTLASPTTSEGQGTGGAGRPPAGAADTSTECAPRYPFDRARLLRPCAFGRPDAP